MIGHGWTPPTRRADTVGGVTSIVPRRLLSRRLRTADLIAVDVLLALSLFALCAYAAAEVPLTVGVREPVWISVSAAALVGGPVAVRRIWPLTVLGVVFVSSAVVLLSGVIPDYAAVPPFLALACALYTVGAARPRRRSVPALIACLAGTLVLLVGIPVTEAGSAASAATVAFVVMLTGMAWLLGRAARERRTYAAQTAEQLTHRAVSDERLRIAREMHDIVSHSMSLIAVKAAVGNHVAETSPAEAREALRVIETTSRGALAELRRTLGVLRDDPSYAPTPGLRDLATLADQAAAGGVDVEMTVTGDDDLPAGVGLSVFRIVQEALTNVVRHAAPARCRVTVTVESGEVRIEVTDDGRRGSRARSGGHGLIGMRERVGMYRGELSAGPCPEGGFRVAGRLPYATVR
ncbi:sensor histidine kinase [Micromonospora sp. KC723]|nr:sensor histidine kinase [Micromonospora sp. KC723]